MLVAITIFFLMYHMVTMFKGTLLHTLAVELGEEKIRKHKEGAENFQENKELKAKVGGIATLSMILSLTQFIYICTLIQRDPYLFPTVGFIVYILVTFLIAVVRPKREPSLETDRDIEKYRKKLKNRITPMYVFNKLLVSVYFAYIIFTMIFMG